MECFEKRIIIYGAKSIALGIFKAVQELYPEYSVMCFMVNSLRHNPSILAGIPVKEVAELSRELNQEERVSIPVLISTPEDIHPEIINILNQYSFKNNICIDSKNESRLMEKYYEKHSIFSSLKKLPIGNKCISLQVFMAKYYKDKLLKKKYEYPMWVDPIQVGADLTDIQVAKYMDNIGDNISYKNVNYCELTALYWIWKNILNHSAKKESERIDYYGLFHYRRILDINNEDLLRFTENKIDVVLQFPTIHEADISEHHTRYVKEEDWEAMLQALEEIRPEYARIFSEVLAQPYFYNYNLIIARKTVLADYCAWLFPILERTESLSNPKGWERADRYIGYLGESLMTLYFFYHKNDLSIVHTGRLMMT